MIRCSRANVKMKFKTFSNVSACADVKVVRCRRLVVVVTFSDLIDLSRPVVTYVVASLL